MERRERGAGVRAPGHLGDICFKKFPERDFFQRRKKAQGASLKSQNFGLAASPLDIGAVLWQKLIILNNHDWIGRKKTILFRECHD